MWVLIEIHSSLFLNIRLKWVSSINRINFDSSRGSELRIYYWCYVKSSVLGGKLFELHDIAGECARLVWENVLNLSKLLIDVGALGSCPEKLIFVKYRHVTIHEGTLEEFDHL